MNGRYEVGPLTGLPRHCRKCGARLRQDQRPAGGFDAFYGMPNMEERRTCPHRQRWLDGHTRTAWLHMTFLPDPPPGPTGQQEDA